MKKGFLLPSETARSIYGEVCALPIYDYHCHLSPREIYEDLPFSDIGEMLLAHDHYKWRLMRAYGIDEEYITGSAPFKQKFCEYARAIQLAAGNPLYHWTMLELDMYFGITEPLTYENAERIYERANAVIAKKGYSPRRLIEMSNVKYIATTDDPADSLEYHQKLLSKACTFKVTPSFRTDNMLLIRRQDYRRYLARLSQAAFVDITDIASFDQAIKKRLDFFCDNGCRFSDVGIPFFPYLAGDDITADRVLKKAISGEDISDDEYSAFLFRMYKFLGCEYKKRGIVMQWHLAVERNVNSSLLLSLGGDAGGDCIGNAVSPVHVAAVLDAINSECGLPKTVIYTLNPTATDALASVVYSFRNAVLGTAWWFCDHKDGIEDIIKVIARTGHIGGFLGMLTDSRSFLSYSRHDYFRRILCKVIAEWVDGGEFCGDYVTLARAICHDNIKNLTETGGA